MKFKQISVSKPFTITASILAAGFCFTAQASALQSYTSPNIDKLARMDSITGTDASPYSIPLGQINSLMNEDQSLSKSESANSAAPAFGAFNTERLIQNRNDGDSLCDILADPHFNMPMIDWGMIEDAWDAFTAATTIKARGINYSAIMNLITKKMMAKLWDKIKKGTCKMAQKASKKIDSSINDAYGNLKQKGIDGVIGSNIAQKIGLTSLDKDGLVNIAATQTSKQLKEYDQYGHWYEQGYLSDKNLSSNIDSIINKQIDKSQQRLVDKFAPDTGDSPIDNINNKIRNKLQI